MTVPVGSAKMMSSLFCVCVILKLVWRAVPVVMFRPDAQTRKKPPGLMVVPAGNGHLVGLVRLSLKNQPDKSAAEAPVLYSSIQSSYSPKLSVVLETLEAENSLMTTCASSKVGDIQLRILYSNDEMLKRVIVRIRLGLFENNF